MIFLRALLREASIGKFEQAYRTSDHIDNIVEQGRHSVLR